jgi:hypothetical protein
MPTTTSHGRSLTYTQVSQKNSRFWSILQNRKSHGKRIHGRRLGILPRNTPFNKRILFLNGGASITWHSKRQMIVARSSTESEYFSLSIGTQEVVWLSRLLTKLGLTESTPKTLPLSYTSQAITSDLAKARKLTMHYDNQSALKLATNPVFHARTKHIEVHHYFIRERVVGGEIRLDYIPIDLQLADIFTKPLHRIKFEQHRAILGLINLAQLNPQTVKP